MTNMSMALMMVMVLQIYTYPKFIELLTLNIYCFFTCVSHFNSVYKKKKGKSWPWVIVPRYVFIKT